MMIVQIEKAIEAMAAKIAASSRQDDVGKYASVIWYLANVLTKLDSCNGGTGASSIIEKLSKLETNLGELIMTTKDEVLATVAAETQEVLEKINADRAEIDAAKAELATAQEQVAADQAELAAKATQIVDLQAQIDALIAAGNGADPAALAEINDAIKLIFTPAVVEPEAPVDPIPVGEGGEPEVLPV